MRQNQKQESSFMTKPRVLTHGEVNTKQLWQQLNLFRQNPQVYYRLISQRKNYYNRQGLLFSLFHPYKSIKTIEGREPLNNLLDKLINMKNLGEIAWNQDLSNAAYAIARQFRSCHSTNAEFQPNGVQMRNMLNLSKNYSFPSSINCVIGIGFCDRYEPLASLLIDDGNSQRRNRTILCTQKYKFCGIGAVLLSDPSLVCGVYLLTESVVDKISESSQS